jgi:hypothetical protein
MPLDKWYKTRWGPVVPPWTKHQSRRARGWLVAISVLAAGSLIYAWATSGSRPPPDRPTPTPSTILLVPSAELLAVASDEARDENPDATPCSLSLYRKLDGGTLTYGAWVIFFAPGDPAWHLGVTVWRERGLLGEGTHTRQTEFPEDTGGWVRCDAAIRHPAADGMDALRAMQEAGAPAMFEYFHPWPVSIRLVEGPEGDAAWEGEFESRTPGDLFRIAVLVDGSTGLVISTQGREWP